MSLNDNFRKDLVGRAYELSKYSAIDGTIEKLSNPTTFNTRFKKIQESVISVVEAMADLASRDKKYLQTFFQGYANPIYTRTYKYSSKLAYLVTSYFSSNGTPVSFNEARIFYDYDDYGNLDTNDSYVYIFKNGILLDSANYEVYNTAYGLKGFIKSSAVLDNDEITIVINKKYNPTIKTFNKPITAAGTTTSFSVSVIDTVNLGIFYNTKYITLYIKKIGASNYIRIPKTNYTIAMDVTGNNLNISVQSYTLAVGDQILVTNTTSFWEYNSTITTLNTDCCVHPYFDLKSNSIPVPFESAYDFDVFYDNLKLIPEVHFNIAYSASPNVCDRLVLNFDVPGNQLHTVKIVKNEPAIVDDFISIYKEELNEKGLEEFATDFKFPIMSKLGYCYINGRFVDNSHLKTRHRSLLEVTDVNVRTDFHYINKIVFNKEFDDILTNLESIPSEMDLVVEYMGLSNVITNLYSSLPVITDIPQDDFITAKSATLRPNAAFWAMFYSYYTYKLTQNSNFILDANDSNGIVDFNALGITSGNLDANECSCQDILLDGNIVF